MNTDVLVRQHMLDLAVNLAATGRIPPETVVSTAEEYLSFMTDSETPIGCQQNFYAPTPLVREHEAGWCYGK